MDSNFEIKQLSKEDVTEFKSLIHLFNTVFEEDKSNIGRDENLLRLLGDNHFIVMAALYEGKVVGGLTAYELPLYSANQAEILLYDLGVKAEYQRKGVGTGLIKKLKEYCAAHRIQEFFVLAHEEDEHAVEFYHATGAKSERVINFIYAAGAE